MFKYQDTNKLSKAGEVQRKVVTKMRKVVYYDDPSDPKVAESVVTEGWEIVEEIVVSPTFDLNSLNVQVVGQKTIDRRNPNRVVKRDFTKQAKED